jgi:sugar phosphate isomerase/epimerase
MRVGVDGRKIPEASLRGPLKSLDHGRELGVDGLFFRTVLEMSPTLDPGELDEIRAHADALGMYLETGLGKVNPFASPEAPELRAIGDGNILLGFERMMTACARIDCRELWIGTANYKGAYRGMYAYDRFRTDVTWEEQLAASVSFLRKLAPIARDLGIHLNMETHEEITTFECLRMIEQVGSDVMGIVFDTANPLQRAEDPVRAARRIAPFVRQTHVKDVAMWFGDDVVYRQGRTCGDGVVDFAAILPILAEHRPDLNLSIENPTTRGGIGITEIYDPVWSAAHPDLTVEEFAAWIRLIKGFEQRVARGQTEAPESLQERDFGYEDAVAYIGESAALLRGIVADMRLPAATAQPSVAGH